MEMSDDDCIILDVIDNTEENCKSNKSSKEKIEIYSSDIMTSTKINSIDIVEEKKKNHLKCTNTLKNVNILSDMNSEGIQFIVNDDIEKMDTGDKQVLKKVPSKRRIKDLTNDGDSNDSETDAQKKKKLRMEAKEAQKMEKEINKIKREIAASINTKAEQYLYCRISNKINEIIPDFKQNIETFFEGRQIRDQLEFEQSISSIITWRRKNVDALVENNTVKRIEMFDLENVFLYILKGEEFKQLHSTNTLINFITKIKEPFYGEVHGVIVIYDKHSINKPSLYNLCLEIYEQTGIQLKFIKNIEKLVLTVGQHHRAIAKKPLCLEKNIEGMIIYNSEKGVKDGSDIHKDWWYKMLSAIHRIGEDQKRAILKHYPNPLDLIVILREIGSFAGVKRISNIQCENGKKIGPVFAQKLVQTLTSINGDEIIEF
uniref:Crossover junction endonuclease MUS81 n=1 Tax=Strongyloides stercoralis TaxID=6248 RepID=A0A0K0EDZ7_STRER